MNFLRYLLQRRVTRFGMAGDARGRFRDPRFASFIHQTNRKTLNTDFQDAVLQGRRLFRYGLVALLCCAAAWVAIESAHALSMF